MSVVTALRTVPHTLRTQPVLFLPVILLFFVPAGQHIVHQVLPLIGPFVSLGISGLLFFIFPLFYGGTLGMANEAVTSGHTSIESFIQTGKQYYVPLFVVTMVILTVIFGLFMATVFVAGIVVAATGITSFQARLLLFAPFVVGCLIVAVICQFCGHAIVIENQRPVKGLTRSARIVVDTPRAVGGHLLVALAGGVVFGGLYSGALGISAVPFFPTFWMPDPTATVPLATALREGLLTVMLGLVGAAFVVYSVVFYRSLISTDNSSTAVIQSADTDGGDAA